MSPSVSPAHPGSAPGPSPSPPPPQQAVEFNGLRLGLEPCLVHVAVRLRSERRSLSKTLCSAVACGRGGDFDLRA
jgi:hypothetical protein